jgi:hypothetical protein
MSGNLDLIHGQVSSLKEDEIDDALNDALMQDLFGLSSTRGALMERDK